MTRRNLLFFILPGLALAAALFLYTRPPTVLYVPLDNRPVNYDYVQAALTHEFFYTLL